MARKKIPPKERLIFALDNLNRDKAREFIRLLRERLGVFKIGLELFTLEGPGFIRGLVEEDIKVFLDLKLHDISETVTKTLRVISNLGIMFTTIHLDNRHPLLCDSIKEITKRGVKVLGVTMLTSIMDGYSSQEIMDIVISKTELALNIGCRGIVCSGKEIEVIRKEFGNKPIIVVPGIRPSWSIVPKDDQQRTVTPYEAITMGADYIVVGRPIRNAEDPLKAVLLLVKEIEEATNHFKN